MKTLLTIATTFFFLQASAQNWIGNKNFLHLFEESDIVVVGTISEIRALQNDTFSLSSVTMPLKSLTLTNVGVLKGRFENHHIYYRDIYNGCGYAPILKENVLNKETLIFAKIMGDSLFQIESFNESPRDIGNAILKYQKIGSSFSSAEFTNWFFETAKSGEILPLLNSMVSLKQSPLFDKVDSINFSIEQRNWFYNKLESFDDYNYDNAGVISMLSKYKDESFSRILKKYLVKLKNEPYSDIDELMRIICKMNGDKGLMRILKQFQEDGRENVRKRLIRDFIVGI